MLAYATKFGDSSAVAQARTYFQDAASGGIDTFLEKTLAGLLSLCQALVEALLEGAAAVVQALTAIIGDLMSAFNSTMTGDLGLGGTFVADLFEFVTGMSFSGLNILSLMVAIPATLAYKAVFNEAPFTSLDRLKATVTADALLRASGLGTDGEVTAAAPAVLGSDALDDFRKVYGVFYSTVYFLDGIFEPILDAIPPTASAPPTLSWLVMGLEWAQVAFGIPWVTGTVGGPNCHKKDGLAVWVWLLGVFSTSGDQLCLLAPKARSLATNAGNMGVAFDVGIGVTNVVMGLLQIIRGKANVAGTETFFGGIVGIGKGGRFTTVVAATDGISLAVTAGLDFVGNEVIWGLSLGTVNNN